MRLEGVRLAAREAGTECFEPYVSPLPPQTTSFANWPNRTASRIIGPYEDLTRSCGQSIRQGDEREFRSDAGRRVSRKGSGIPRATFCRSSFRADTRTGS